MPQTIILKGQAHAFPAAAIAVNIDVVTTNPATGTLTYTAGANGPVVVPYGENRVYQFTLPMNGNPLTIINNTTSGLSCTY